MTDALASPRLQFGFRFVVLARRWRTALDARLAGAGLTDATWAPLMHLHRSGDGLCQRELAQQMGVDGSSLVRLLDILAGKGLIERRTDAADRRAKRVFLTEDGKAVLGDIGRHLAAAEFDMLADLSDAELAQVLAAFDKIDDRIRCGRDNGK